MTTPLDDGDGDGAVALAPRPASASHTVTNTWMEIEHANNAGNVHGGVIMRLVDTAAGIAAVRHCRGRVVTAALDEMIFISPIYIGDLVTVTAAVNDAHRTSMEVGVTVVAEDVASGEKRVVSNAHLIFVALDDAGKPTPVSPVLAETDVEKTRQTQARVRRDQRLVRKAALMRAVEATGLS